MLVLSSCEYFGFRTNRMTTFLALKCAGSPCGPSRWVAQGKRTSDAVTSRAHCQRRMRLTPDSLLTVTWH